MTAQVLFARQLQATIDQTQEAVKAVLAGNLSQRISVEGKTGQMEALSRGLNQLFDSLHGVVSDINAAVERAARHDLTARVDETSKTGAFGKLVSGVNALIGDMVSLVQQMKSSARDVRSGAEEISKGNLDLSQRTEQQASSLEKTAASMEQMTATVRQTADNAGLANQLAMEAFKQAENGGEVASAAAAAMAG